MVVIADSSPLHYLILIDAADVLRALFGVVKIPEAVFKELQHKNAPAKVAAWLSRRPPWLHVEQTFAEPPDAEFSQLGEGERAAIRLALEQGPEALLLIDELKGRRVAEGRGIRFMGTLGVLERAAASGQIDLPAMVERLLQTNIRISPALLKALLDENSRRRSAPKSQ